MNTKWQNETQAWMIREGLLPSSGARTPDEKATLASLRALVEAAQQETKAAEERANTIAYLKKRAKRLAKEHGFVAQDIVQKIVGGIAAGEQDASRNDCSACGGDGGFGAPPGSCVKCEPCGGTGRRADQKFLGQARPR